MRYYTKDSDGNFDLVPVDEFIRKSLGEIQSGFDRVMWAEQLILQLPEGHDGRNSWLLNYGMSKEAELLRSEIMKQGMVDGQLPIWDLGTKSLYLTGVRDDTGA